MIVRSVTAPTSRLTYGILAAPRSRAIFAGEDMTGDEKETHTMKTDHLHRRVRSVLTIAALSALVSSSLIASTRAQDLPFVDTERGTFLIHGNYCGPGNRSPRPPIDALDVACMHHDMCSPPRGQLPTCSCNARLQREAEAVSLDPRQPASLRDTAGFVAETATALPCR